MPPLACPRCQRTNPQDAAFCYFDGALLRGAGGDGAATPKLPHEFIFPSGRRCRTYDDLAVGCQEEWNAARDLLRQGVFRQYFTSIGRMDLARSAQEAMGQGSPDIGLTQLVGTLPTSVAVQGPKLDLHPRRLLLGSLFAGETRQIQLTVTNQGRGMLQGTVAVTEGDWLKLGGGDAQQAVQTAREQQVVLQVDTRGLAAGQTYGGKLTVITNGGVVEVPARVDLAAHPFPKAPFQGARAQREMAERMRGNPKGAAALLEGGDLPKWFASNGWKYPVAGSSAKGVAGVQQFFEAMGLSKPPAVQLAPEEVRVVCKDGERARGQLALRTRAKKWVYGSVTSDSPWLRVLTPAVSGPQQASVAFEVDPRQLPGRRAEGTLRVAANAGQILTARVRAESVGGRVAAGRAARREGGSLAGAVCAAALAFLIVRFLMIFPSDFQARPKATAWAAARTAKVADVALLPEDSPARSFGGWLLLPWSRLLITGNGDLPEALLGAPAGPAAARAFRDDFVGRYLWLTVLFTAWLGAVLWPLFLLRRGGGAADIPWGIISGAVLGTIASATLACLILVGDLVPELLWDVTLRGSGSAAALLPVWLLLALACWAGLGALVGLVLHLLGPPGRAALAPVRHSMAWLFRMCGLAGLADFCAPA
jgi:hypothetical protein